MQIRLKRKKTERRSLVVSVSLNLIRNSLLKGKCSTLKIKYGQSKGLLEKVSTRGVWCG